MVLVVYNLFFFTLVNSLEFSSSSLLIYVAHVMLVKWLSDKCFTYIEGLAISFYALQFHWKQLRHLLSIHSFQFEYILLINAYDRLSRNVSHICAHITKTFCICLLSRAHHFICRTRHENLSAHDWSTCLDVTFVRGALLCSEITMEGEKDVV